MAIGVYSLLRTNDIKRNFDKIAKKSEIDPYTAKAFLRISSRLQFSA